MSKNVVGKGRAAHKNRAFFEAREMALGWTLKKVAKPRENRLWKASLPAKKGYNLDMENVPPNRCRSDTGLDRTRNQIEVIYCEGEEEVVAMSPNGNLYNDYESIPRISRPRFLMLKEETIIADGWLIQIACTEQCLEFIIRICSDWKDGTKDGLRQLNGFLDAVQTILVGESTPYSDEDDGLSV